MSRGYSCGPPRFQQLSPRPQNPPVYPFPVALRTCHASTLHLPQELSQDELFELVDSKVKTEGAGGNSDTSRRRNHRVGGGSGSGLEHPRGLDGSDGPEDKEEGEEEEDDDDMGEGGSSEAAMYVGQLGGSSDSDDGNAGQASQRVRRRKKIKKSSATVAISEGGSSSGGGGGCGSVGDSGSGTTAAAGDSSGGRTGGGGATKSTVSDHVPRFLVSALSSYILIPTKAEKPVGLSCGIRYLFLLRIDFESRPPFPPWVVFFGVQPSQSSAPLPVMQCSLSVPVYTRRPQIGLTMTPNA